MPRFVLLRHECPARYKASHWDFMVERDGVLHSWSLAALPRSWATALGVDGAPADMVDAVRLPDHRLAYLDYEGVVSGNRGEVCRWDGGEFLGLEAGKSDLRAVLRGAALQAAVLLTCIDGERWRLEAMPGDLRNA